MQNPCRTCGTYSDSWVEFKTKNQQSKIPFENPDCVFSTIVRPADLLDGRSTCLMGDQTATWNFNTEPTATCDSGVSRIGTMFANLSGCVQSNRIAQFSIAVFPRTKCRERLVSLGGERKRFQIDTILKFRQLRNGEGRGVFAGGIDLNILGAVFGLQMHAKYATPDEFRVDFSRMPGYLTCDIGCTSSSR